MDVNKYADNNIVRFPAFVFGRKDDVGNTTLKVSQLEENPCFLDIPYLWREA